MHALEKGDGMNTFKEYIGGEIAEAEAKPLKWAVDKKLENNVLLKDGGKILYRMFRYKSKGHESHPYGVCITKSSVNDCTSVEASIDFLRHMMSTAHFGKYSVPEMPKDVKDWLDR